MVIQFKLGTGESIPDIMEMMKEFNSIDNYFFDISATMQNLQEFMDNKELGRLWIIMHDREIAGYIVLTFGFSFEHRGRDAFVDELFIKKHFRNRGLGTMSIEFVEREAQKLGVKAIHLEVEMHNEIGLNLYRKLGYKGNKRSLLAKRID